MHLFKTRETIADELDINRKTLYEKLRKANIKLPQGLVAPEFQQIIYDYFRIYPPGWVNLTPSYPKVTPK